MSDMDTNLDNTYSFEYIEAIINDTSTRGGRRYIGEVQDIKIDDIEHFNSRLTRERIGAFLALGIICFILAIAAAVALPIFVDIDYLGLALAGVFGLLTVIFLILYAVKSKAYFHMEIYFGKYRDDILDVNYNSSFVNFGNKFPAKVEVYCKLKKKDLAGKHSQFMSKLGSLMAENKVNAAPAPYGLFPYAMPFAGLGYPGMAPAAPAYCIEIDPETKTVSLTSVY